MEEIWKDIKGYEGFYQVSNLGRVKSLKRKVEGRKGYLPEIIMKPSLTTHKYHQIVLTKKGIKTFYALHRVVAEAFLNKNDYKMMNYEKKEQINLKDLQVNHKDENKLNNCVNNLEWCTPSYNVNYGTGTIKRKIKLYKKVIQYDTKGIYIKEWDSITIASKELNISRFGIIACCKERSQTSGGFIWKYANNR